MQKKQMELKVAQSNTAIEMQKKDMELQMRVKNVEIEVLEEKKRTELVEARRNNTVMEATFEGKAQGGLIAAFMEALPKEMTMEERHAVWDRIRDNEMTAAYYSLLNNKADISLQMMPQGADVHQLRLTMDKDTRELAAGQPLLMPSILGYDRTLAGSMATAATAAGKSGSIAIPAMFSNTMKAAGAAK